MLGLGLVLMLAAASAVVLQNDTPRDDTSDPAVTTVVDSEPRPETTTASVPAATQPASESTPAPASTTTMALSGVDAEVQAAVLGYYDYYWRCLRAPAGCEPGRATAEGSTAFDELADVARTLVQNGLFVGAEDAGDIDIESIVADGDRATVTTCWWTTAVLYLQSPIQGDPPIAQTNAPTSGHQIYEVTRDQTDGIWRIQRTDQVGDLTENENQCRSAG